MSSKKSHTDLKLDYQEKESADHKDEKKQS